MKLHKNKQLFADAINAASAFRPLFTPSVSRNNSSLILTDIIASIRLSTSGLTEKVTTVS